MNLWDGVTGQIYIKRLLHYEAPILMLERYRKIIIKINRDNLMELPPKNSNCNKNVCIIGNKKYFNLKF